MAIYSFWVFDRHCNCIYSREWSLANLKKQVASSQPPSQSLQAQSQQFQSQQVGSGSINVKNEDNAAKLLFGALFSLKQISNKLNHSESENNNFKSFSTSKYRCHFFESGTGLKFCLLTDPKVENMQFALKEIYTNLYLSSVVKNSLSQIDFKEGEYINNDKFINGVDSYIGSLQAFAV